MRVLFVALVAALVAYGLRSAHVLAHEPDGRAGLVAPYDPDSLYHARRVERAVAEGGAVAGRDTRLGWPDGDGRGAPIPWPPYYDWALARVASLRGADAGDAPEVVESRRALAADTVARAPAWLAAWAAALAALASAGLVRAHGGQRKLAAAAVAGLGVALSFAHLRYSFVGMGDHHTAVGALTLLLYWLVGRGVEAHAVRGPRSSAVRGALAGLVAAALLGTWVASIALVVPVQLALLWILLRPGPPAPVGLVLFSTSFHKAALLGLLPAVLTSPWTELRPFDVVNLSWFHIAWFGVTWLAFAPVVFLPRAGARRVPALLAAALLVALVLLARSGAAEALEWAAASNEFMSSINESQPLVDITSPGASVAAVGKWLGWGIVLVPIAWAVIARRALRRQADAALPWLIALPPLLLAAAAQRRFAEVVAPLAAVLLGVLVAWALPRGRRVAALLGLLALAHVGTFEATRTRLRAGTLFESPHSDGAARQDAMFAALEELREARAGADAEPLGVLAQWDVGHAVEWFAEAPTVATNFGLYLGREGFVAPWRYFYSAESEREGAFAGETMLAELAVSHLVVTRGDRRNIGAALAALPGELTDPAHIEAWRATRLARLLAADGGDAPPHPPYLRLVAASCVWGRGPQPWARVFEVVPGATVELEGFEPGAEATVRVNVLAGDDRLLWSDEASVSASGTARLRIPYATRGGALPATRLDLRVDGLDLPLELEDEDIRSGATFRLTRP